MRRRSPPRNDPKISFPPHLFVTIQRTARSARHHHPRSDFISGSRHFRTASAFCIHRARRGAEKNRTSPIRERISKNPKDRRNNLEGREIGARKTGFNSNFLAGSDFW